MSNCCWRSAGTLTSSRLGNAVSQVTSSHCPATFAVFAALHECALDLDLGSQQMLPLIPGTVPEGMQGGWVQPQL